MPYIINKADGTPLTTLEDGTLDNSTSLGLIGRNYTGYGETQNENFLLLLENFANSNPPARPLEGQTWFNKTTKTLFSYNGTAWSPVGAAYTGNVPPAENDGQLWYKVSSDQLYVYYNNSWNLIGPEALDGFGETKWRTSILKDVDDVDRPVSELVIDGVVNAIATPVDFTIKPTNPRTGFFNLKAGINLRSDKNYIGNVIGSATVAASLQTPRTINDVAFDGTQNINITASTPNQLTAGNFLTGTAFNGSAPATWNVQATSSNTVGRIVARDSAGDFEAGTITADLIGNVTGNVTATTGTSSFNNINANLVVSNLIGNSTTASRLETPRTINGVSFNGQNDITITSAAGTLTGTALASNVISSSLTSVGVLNFLRTGETGVYVGTTDQFRIHIDGVTPTIRIINNQKLKIDLIDTATVAGRIEVNLIPSQESVSLGGANQPAFIPDTANNVNLGHPFAKWDKIYANTFEGYILADDVRGGLRGSILYQNNPNSTDKLTIGSLGQVLRVGASGLPEWQSASNSNVGNSLVVRDSVGNFAAGTITASLSGNATTATLAAAATKLQTARRINGILFDGTADINVSGTTPVWAGVTSLGNIIATYANNTAYPVGFKVAFLQERTINIFTGNGAVYFTEYYRRVVEKINTSNGWTDVGG